MRRTSTGDVLVAPLREAALRRINQGATWGELAREAGFIRERGWADTTRLKRMLGVMPGSKGEYYKACGEARAVRLCEVLGVDLADLEVLPDPQTPEERRERARTRDRKRRERARREAELGRKRGRYHANREAEVNRKRAARGMPLKYAPPVCINPECEAELRKPSESGLCGFCICEGVEVPERAEAA
jgi:hypothetical protein